MTLPVPIPPGCYAATDVLLRSIGRLLVVLASLTGGNAWAQVDCMGIPDGTNLPGTPCDDADPMTINDVWSELCECHGADMAFDCLGMPWGAALPGTPCDDADPLTIHDVWTPACTCTGGWGSISGQVFLDANGSGTFDAGDLPITERTVSAMPGGHYTTTDASGAFAFLLPPGTYTLAVSATNAYVQAEPHPPVDLTADMTSAGHALAMIAPQGRLDLAAYVGTTQPRPGFLNLAMATCRNEGTVALGGQLTFTFDPLQEFVSSDGAAMVSGNTVSWEVDALPLGGSITHEVLLRTPASVDLSTLLTCSAVVQADPSDDLPDNDERSFTTDVVGSFDPNDKRVEPARLTPDELQDGRSVIYTIRFQNTGTFLAENVRITDALSPDLDRSTFAFLGSSHPCTVDLTDGMLQFTFDGIMLPDSGSDQLASHGQVMFSITPDPGLLPGAVVPNQASIHFDFNAPVVTDPALLTIETGTGMRARQEVAARLWPNPSGDQLNVVLHAPIAGPARAIITDACGRVVLGVPWPPGSSAIDVGLLADGPYVLGILAPGRTITVPFIKGE